VVPAALAQFTTGAIPLNGLLTDYGN